MKILAFTDMHGSLKALNEIKQKAKDADLIVCAGDFSIFEQKIEYFLDQFNKLKKPFLVIPGNHETGEDMQKASYLFENIINLHKTTKAVDNYLFIGYGEGGFSMTDKRFEKFGKAMEHHLKKHKGKKVILVTHAPPYNTKLDRISGEPCGNKSIKNFILRAKPDLVISGHLHENAGKHDKLGKITMINPGPLGKIVEI